MLPYSQHLVLVFQFVLRSSQKLAFYTKVEQLLTILKFSTIFYLNVRDREKNYISFQFGLRAKPQLGFVIKLCNNIGKSLLTQNVTTRPPFLLFYGVKNENWKNPYDVCIYIVLPRNKEHSCKISWRSVKGFGRNREIDIHRNITCPTVYRLTRFCWKFSILSSNYFCYDFYQLYEWYRCYHSVPYLACW